MKNLLRFSLSLLFTLAGTQILRAAETNSPTTWDHSIEVEIRSGANMKEMRSHLFLLVARRHADNSGATAGRAELLHTRGYNYAAGDKWGPNETKTFGPYVSFDHLAKETSVVWR